MHSTRRDLPPMCFTPQRTVLRQWRRPVTSGCGLRNSLAIAVAGLLMVHAAAGSAAAQDGCPTALQFRANQASSDLDVGWTGLFHDGKVDAQFDFAVSGCDGAPPSCGVCTVSGPIASAGGHCSGDASRWCTTDGDCAFVAAGTCVFYLGAPSPLSGGGLSVCIANEIAGAVTGTVDTADCGIVGGTLAVAVASYVHAGVSVSAPCPLCDGGICTAGLRAGLPCTGSGVNEVFGNTSIDCPPDPATNIGTSSSALNLQLGGQTWTLSAASPSCRAAGFTGNKCFCDTCSNAAAAPCSSNADCAGGATCGGRRCQGGANNGAACSVTSACPGGACAVPGAATRPNACNDGECTPHTPPDNDSVDEGECAGGPFECFCAIETFRGCTSDADCTADADDACTFCKNRECFTDNGVIGGTVSVGGDDLTLGSLSCAVPTTSSAVNAVAGLPGLTRITLPGTFTLSPCCDEEGDDTEEDEDEEIDRVVGDVPDLYGSSNTATDTWYPNIPCDPSIGGELDPEDLDPEDDDLSEDVLSQKCCAGAPYQQCTIDQDCENRCVEDPLETCTANSPGCTCTATTPCGPCFGNLTTAEAEALLDEVEQADATMDDEEAAEPPIVLGPASDPNDPYTEPSPQPTPDTGCYAFGGRDIVFVHGYRRTPMKAAFHTRYKDHERATTKWVIPTEFPGCRQNPSFYGPNSHYGQNDCPTPPATGPNGTVLPGDYYWKLGAEKYWTKHINRFLTERHFKNRYLVVAWASPQRLEIGAHAVLTQIADAMKYGIGVVNPVDPDDTAGFGSPSFVVVSHSAGGPTTDVAMYLANTDPSLNAAFIPQHAKAHIAFQAAFGGSRVARVPLALAGLGALASVAACVPHPLSPPCLLMCALSEIVMGDNACFFNTLIDARRSVLRDLVPGTMRRKWGDAMEGTPVRTVTVVGGHPSPKKQARLLNPGFDDGTVTINSQVANPNKGRHEPSGYVFHGNKREVKDKGIKVTLGNPKRARKFFRDQTRRIPSSDFVAAGATPWLSPTGMVQPSHDDFASDSKFSPLRRYGNHFSFLQDTAAHFDHTPSALLLCEDGPKKGALCATNAECEPSGGSHECKEKDEEHFHGDDYEPTTKNFGDSERNWEENRVITNPAIYDTYCTLGNCSMGNDPLLRSTTVTYSFFGHNYSWQQASDLPGMEEITRGKQKKQKKNKPTKWRWKRTYHLLKNRLGSKEFRVAGDYVYGAILADDLIGDCMDAPPPGPNTCTSNKKICAAKYACARLKCYGNAIKNGVAVDALCLERARTKFRSCFQRVEAKQRILKPPTVCPAGSRDASIVATTVFDFVNQVIDQLGDTPVGVEACRALGARCVCKKLQALLKCHAKAEKKGIPVDSACIAKAETGFSQCFAQVEALCPVASTGAEMETMVDEFVDKVVCQIDGTC